MTYPTKCTLAMVLWVGGILILTGGCSPMERNVTLPKSSFDRLLGGPAATDTNITARIDFLAIALNREILQESNNWYVVTTVIGRLNDRIAALEAKLAPLPGPPVAVPQVPPAIPPLTSAPVIPGIEKGTP